MLINKLNQLPDKIINPVDNLDYYLHIIKAENQWQVCYIHNYNDKEWGDVINYWKEDGKELFVVSTHGLKHNNEIHHLAYSHMVSGDDLIHCVDTMLEMVNTGTFDK